MATSRIKPRAQDLARGIPTTKIHNAGSQNFKMLPSVKNVSIRPILIWKYCLELRERKDSN
jgi:hypothetical protein